jgi:hypothetical protein
MLIIKNKQYIFDKKIYHSIEKLNIESYKIYEIFRTFLIIQLIFVLIQLSSCQLFCFRNELIWNIKD